MTTTHIIRCVNPPEVTFTQNGSPFLPIKTFRKRSTVCEMLVSVLVVSSFRHFILQIHAEFIEKLRVKNTTGSDDIDCLPSGQYYEYFPASSSSLRYPVSTSDTQEQPLGSCLFCRFNVQSLSFEFLWKQR